MTWQYILARLKEPSTYAGLGLVLGAVGLHLTAAQTDAVTQGLMAAAGLVSVFVPEAAHQ